MVAIAPVEPPKPMNVLAVIDKGHRYMFLFDDNSTTQALQVIGRWACSSEIGLTWGHATDLARRIRAIEQQHQR